MSAQQPGGVTGTSQSGSQQLLASGPAFPSPSTRIMHMEQGLPAQGTTCIAHHGTLPVTPTPGTQCSTRVVSPPRAVPGAVLGWPLPSSHPCSCRIWP